MYQCVDLYVYIDIDVYICICFKKTLYDYKCRLYIYMNVCMHVRMYVRMDACMYACISAYHIYYTPPLMAKKTVEPSYPCRFSQYNLLYRS